MEQQGRKGSNWSQVTKWERIFAIKIIKGCYQEFVKNSYKEKNAKKHKLEFQKIGKTYEEKYKKMASLIHN